MSKKEREIAEVKSDELVVLSTLEMPTQFLSAPNLTDDFSLCPQRREGDTVYVTLGKGREVPWTTSMTISQNDLERLNEIFTKVLTPEIINQNPGLKKRFKEVSTADFEVVKQNITQTQSKLGYRHQGQELGFATFCTRDIKKKSCIPYSSKLMLLSKKEMDALDMDKNPNGVYVDLGKDIDIFLCVMPDDKMAAGLLCQHAPEEAHIKPEKYELNNEDDHNVQCRLLDPSLKDEIASANFAMAFYVNRYEEGEKKNKIKQLHCVLIAQRDIKAGEIAVWDYFARKYWDSAKKRPESFYKNGRIIDPKKIDRTVDISLSKPIEISSLFYQSEIDEILQNEFYFLKLRNQDKLKNIFITGKLLQDEIKGKGPFYSIIHVKHPNIKVYAHDKELMADFEKAISEIIGFEQKHLSLRFDNNGPLINVGVLILSVSPNSKNLTPLQVANLLITKDNFTKKSFGAKNKELQVSSGELYNRLILKLYSNPAAKEEAKKDNDAGNKATPSASALIALSVAANRGKRKSTETTEATEAAETMEAETMEDESPAPGGIS